MYLCAVSEDSEHLRRLIRIFTRRTLDSQGYEVSSCGKKTDETERCKGYYESSLAVHVSRSVISRCSSNISDIALRKHVYLILRPKKENFQLKNSDIFHILAQNIVFGYSLEPQAVLMSTYNLCFIEKCVHPCKP